MPLFFIRFFLWVARGILSLRYKVEVRGLDEVAQRVKSGGALFLPNHPAYIDPVILILYLWPKFHFRPMSLGEVNRIPVLGWFFRTALGAISIPSFRSGVNSYKVELAKRALQSVVDGLHEEENFLIYPAGRLKRSGEERVGGASAVHEIVQVSPESEMVLIRTTGLWGSLFGWALEGPPPTLGGGLARGVKILAKNLFLFAPRRRVVVELEVAPAAWRSETDRDRFNRLLEGWYGGEPLKLVSYSRWHKQLPTPREERVAHTGRPSEASSALQAEVVAEVARVARKRPEEISLETHLFDDLNLDSLDIAELAAALDRDGYRTPDVALDMMTVGGLVSLVAGELEEGSWEEKREERRRWFGSASGRSIPLLPEGRTLPEIFLRSCSRMGSREAAADAASGLCSYRYLKERVVLLADYFKTHHLRETRIGVMLPASVAAQVVVFAIQLSGRIPVMINWTLGARYTEAMREVTGVTTVISSSAFIDRLNNVDLTPIHDQLLLLEEVAGKITLRAFLEAKFVSWMPYAWAEGRYRLHYRHPDDHAVILFTSGTESLPKAVPLTHGNIVSDLRGAASCISFTERDIFLGMLPPFHSFGFSVTGCFPLLGGMRVLFSPDPTHTRRLVEDIERGGVTTLCAAPTFLRSIFRVGTKEELGSLRLIVSGAEKAPEALFLQAKEIGAEIIEGYGITECAPIVTMNRLGLVRRGVGQPIPGVELRIVDPESYEVRPVGESGLILIRGPNLFVSYLGMSASWPFVELEGELWYDSGDLGMVDKDGYLTLVGRKKRFVKMGGEMVSLPAMEEILLRKATEMGWDPEPRVAIVSQELEGERPQLHLFTNFGVDLEVANGAVKEAGLSNLARLSRCHRIDPFPSLGTGKCDYRTLQELAAK